MATQVVTERDEATGGTGRAVAALLVAMLSFQIGASIAKGLFPMVGAGGTTALRQVFGAALLAVAMRPWRQRPTRRVLPALILYGVSLGAMNLLFYEALRTVPLGIAVAIEFSGPLAVAAASMRRPADFLWIGCAVAGLACLLPWRQAAHGIDPKGAMLALAAGVGWALYMLAGRRAGAELGGRAVAWGMIVAALVSAPIGIVQAGRALLDPTVLAVGAVVGLLSTALPYALEMVALTRLPARAYGTMTSLDPALGALAGLAVLGETLTAIQLVGIAAIVAASAGTALSLHPPPATVPN